MTIGRRIELRGVVQGVGFRPWIYRVATEQGIAGHVRNDGYGVTVDAFGSAEAIDNFLRHLEGAFSPELRNERPAFVDVTSAPPAVAIRELRLTAIPVAPVDTFRIVLSEAGAGRHVSIPPDLPTCPDCLAELFDPGDRRYRYPFITCTNCGPRFTIAGDIPYDRSSTTMAAFRMCEGCQREYDSAGDRRFHAETNACPVCGPQLRLLAPDGSVVAHADPTAAAAAAIVAGQLVAVKGLGGFHLACDASSVDAVRTLRARKRRDAKPFAVMVVDMDAARALAELSPEEQRLLESPERPIVLARRRHDATLAPGVAPDNPLVGLLLPYTPLHHLLMREAGRPVVMTSGNLSDEPIAHRNEDALERLGNIADLLLVHNRDIETACDDSVARVIAHRPVVLRRSRGYVPRPVPVPHRFDRPVLACGALLKNTFCIGSEKSAYFGPHIGDLEHLEAYQSFESAITRMERFLGVAPEIIAHDLHPDYASTRYAMARPEAVKIAVQHHHAHVVSAMAEHGIDGPVIGVAYDGTGYGTDGAAWGGEVLLARDESFERVATLRPIPLAGGDAAIRQPWRIALALVEDAFDGRAPLDALRLFSAIAPRDLQVVRQLLAGQIRSPLAHGCGRYFDGIGALALMKGESRFEGDVALQWNVVADPMEGAHYPYEVDQRSSPWTVDLRPMVRGVVADLGAGAPAGAISARFHNTLVAATAAVVAEAARMHGRLPVVLTGGCFQNPRLAEGLVSALTARFTVHLHRDVPPGDGGIALGQALVAAAVARSGGC